MSHAVKYIIQAWLAGLRPTKIISQGILTNDDNVLLMNKFQLFDQGSEIVPTKIDNSCLAAGILLHA
jgi:hypothetical protein